MKKNEKVLVKKYIDERLDRYTSLPIEIYVAILKDFQNDYNVEELTKKVSLQTSAFGAAEYAIDNKTIHLIVDNFTKYDHEDLSFMWKLLSQCYAKFSQATINKYKDKLDWDEISNLNPDEEFIEKNKKFINFNLLNCAQKSMKFFDTYVDKINWNKVKWSEVEGEIVKKYQSKIEVVKFKIDDEDEGIIYGHCDSEFVEKHQDVVPKITIEDIIARSMDNTPSNWDHISLYYGLDEEFIDYCEHRLNWRIASYAQKMSLELLLKLKDNIDVKYLKENKKISQEVKDEFLKQVEEV